MKVKSLKLLLFSILALLSITLVECNPNANPGSQKTDYFPTGKIRSIKNFANGQLNGTCIWFYENGKIEQYITYVKGDIEGHAYLFYPSGALKVRALYKNNKEVGYSEVFYDHSIGLIKDVFVYDEQGKLLYKKELDTAGKIVREEGHY